MDDDGKTSNFVVLSPVFPSKYFGENMILFQADFD